MHRYGMVAVAGMCILGFLAGGVAADESSYQVGGDQGWYVFHCHADGAEVYLDTDLKGVITDNELSVPVYSTGKPYSRYTVTYDIPGYHREITESLTTIPRKGETVDIYIDITPVPIPVPTPAPKPVGGDQGWYDVYCNVDGALVSFDGVEKGTISGNLLAVPVYVTGSPYSSITVTAPDYVPVTEAITRYPGKDETVDIYITLNRETDEPVIMAPGR